jgi:RNA polymerase sigma factor for flagellar operon FliA
MNDEGVQARLIDECQGLVRSLALGIHRKLPPHVELDDLIAYGQLGLVEAARDFDAARGSRFSTYAYHRIRGAIYDGLSKMSWVHRTHQEQVRYEQMAGEVLAAESEPTHEAPVAGNEETDVRWLRDLTRALAVVYLATRKRPGCDEELIPLEDKQGSPASVAMDHEICQRIHELVDALPRDEGELVRIVYFEELTLQEAARRLGISKSWASRLHTKALQRLARSLRALEPVS